MSKTWFSVLSCERDEKKIGDENTKLDEVLKGDWKEEERKEREDEKRKKRVKQINVKEKQNRLHFIRKKCTPFSLTDLYKRFTGWETNKAKHIFYLAISFLGSCSKEIKKYLPFYYKHFLGLFFCRGCCTHQTRFCTSCKTSSTRCVGSSALKCPSSIIAPHPKTLLFCCFST